MTTNSGDGPSESAAGHLAEIVGAELLKQVQSAPAVGSRFNRSLEVAA